MQKHTKKEIYVNTFIAPVQAGRPHTPVEKDSRTLVATMYKRVLIIFQRFDMIVFLRVYPMYTQYPEEDCRVKTLVKY